MIRPVFLAVAIVSVAGALSACDDKHRETEKVFPDITVAYPEQRTVTLYKEYPGYISSWSSVDVVARVSGYLQKSLFEAGDLVTEGQLLYVVEPTLYKNAVQQAEADLLNAKAAYEYARNNYSRMEEAYGSNAVSEIDLIQAHSEMQKAEAAVSKARAELNTAQTNLGYCYIRAPYTGHAGLGEYGVGAYIPGGASPAKMVTVYKDSAMYAYFTIEDAQYLKIVENLRRKEPQDSDRLVEIIARELSEPYIGTVKYLSPSIDLSTGTLTLRATVDNPRGELKNGLYVVVRIKAVYDENALLVSNVAIGTDQLGKYIYVVGDDNRVEYRHIETGDVVDDSLCIVKSGISPTERYVTRAILKVRDGMAVNPVM